ncbi:MAG: nucleotidyl transferase AbiEii/AbiGii toxin family protein [Bacilli bacterium]|nr:nucleotidyl transferase AbiEii/AbiGii toxin family protein [Bacilli bacterium]
MNSMQLKAKLKNLSIEKDVDFNTLLRIYMYDRFIERLSNSQYSKNFVIKGGFYLSTLYGVESRSTMDIDTMFRNAEFDEKVLVNMFNEIINIDLNDNITFKIIDVDTIRDEDEYGGFRFNFVASLENINEKFHIDVATGDPITPKAIIFKYIPLLGDGYINVYAYNIETVLAEKLETILSRLELNGRMRDFYDIYLIYSKDSEKISKSTLRTAIENTFKKREFKGDIIKNFKIVKESTILRKRWAMYSRKYSYAKDIEYDEILGYIQKLIETVEMIFV